MKRLRISHHGEFYIIDEVNQRTVLGDFIKVKKISVSRDTGLLTPTPSGNKCILAMGVRILSNTPVIDAEIMSIDNWTYRQWLKLLGFGVVELVLEKRAIKSQQGQVHEWYCPRLYMPREIPSES